MRDIAEAVVAKKAAVAATREPHAVSAQPFRLKPELQPLQNAATYWRAFHAAPNPYSLLSPELVILDANAAYLAATMTRYGDIVGQPLREVFGDNLDDAGAGNLPNVKASVQTVLATRCAHRMGVQRFTLRRADGLLEERHWMSEILPVLDDSGRVGNVILHVEAMPAAAEVAATLRSIAIYTSAEEFLTHAGGGNGYFIVDPDMPGTETSELLAQLRRKGVEIFVVMVTKDASIAVSVAAKKVMKAMRFAAVEKSMEANASDPKLPPSPHRAVLGRLGRLTRRQREVFDLIIAGHTNRDVAERLGVSQRTVETHRALVMTKMEAESLAELVHLAEVSISGA